VVNPLSTASSAPTLITPGLAQEFADGAIRGLVEITPVHAGLHLRAQLQLQLVEPPDQRRELGVLE
jgi:hypothetical protein